MDDLRTVTLSTAHTFLGCLLNDVSLMAKYRALPSGVFVEQNDRLYFEAMRDLFGEYGLFDVDAIARKMELSSDSPLLVELRYMYLNNPSSQLHKLYADLLYGEAMRYYVQELGREVQANSYTEDPDKIMSEAEDKIRKIRSWKQQGGLKSLSESHSRIYDKLCNDKDNMYTPKILTGYNELDKHYGQLLGNQLHVIAARPRMGKSMFALNVAVNIAAKGFKVLYFSLEMGEEQTMTRYLQVVHGVKNDEFTGLSMSFLEKFSTLVPPNDNLYFCYQAGLTVQDVEGIIIKQKELIGKIDVVIIDHIHLMRAKADNPTQETMMVSRGLKIVAGTQNVPIIALAQMNRDVEKRTSKEPQLSDLAQSGAIEQDAETVLFLHRDEDPDCNPNILNLLCRKNRNGVGFFNATALIDFSTYRITQHDFTSTGTTQRPTNKTRRTRDTSQ